MKLRLFTAILAAAALGGCATYDYAGGSAPGGYYYGRAPVDSYGPYGGGYGYGPSYGYGGYAGYGYGYGGYGYSPTPYYGGYYPYRPHRPHHPRPPRPDDNNNPPRGDRPPPWRHPDGRYQETGGVMIPPRNRVQQAPSQPQVRADGGQPRFPGIRPNGGGQPPRMAPQSPPRQMERAPRPVERSVERARPAPRSQSREGVRTEEP